MQARKQIFTTTKSKKKFINVLDEEMKNFHSNICPNIEEIVSTDQAHVSHKHKRMSKLRSV